MIQLSYQEIYVLWFISQMNDCTDPSKVLGLYVCYFLDDLEAKGLDTQEEGLVDEYLRQSGNELFRKNRLSPAVKRLTDLDLLDVKKERLFKHFSKIVIASPLKGRSNPWITTPSLRARDDESGKGRLNEYILEVLQNHKPFKNLQKLNTIIEVFNEKLFSFLRSFEKKDEKFELRLFWPESIVPEVYEIGDLFAEEKYKHDHEQDVYLLGDKNRVIKVRGNQLQEKSCTLDFYGIGRFIKKKKVGLPADKRDSLQSQAIEIVKKRHIYKGDSQVKIEFATLKVQGEKWRTICIESPSLPTVLAYSLLINPEHGERLNYAGLVGKFYSVP